MIPQTVFDLHEYKIPFTDTSKRKIVAYDYEQDLDNKPSLSQLPRSLWNALYDFQKVGV